MALHAGARAVLAERNWLKAIEQNSVNDYICGAATKILEYQKITDDKEYTEAARNGYQLMGLLDFDCSEEEVQRVGIEEIPDTLSSLAPVADYSAMPGPDKLRDALQMLHEGYKEANVAEAIGTDSKHFRQTIRRIFEQMEPDRKEALADWINCREFYSASYTMELSSILAKMGISKVHRLRTSPMQPDPTRTRFAKQFGATRQLWMKAINDYRWCDRSRLNGCELRYAN